MAEKKTKINTYERIVEAALQLFNQEAERNISTNHIAAFLGISPGNLYYYFHNKDEIIMELYKRYRRDLTQFLQSSKPPQTAVEVKDFIMTVYEIMWQYRFLFSDVTALLARNSELQMEHEKFTINEVAPTIEQSLQYLVDQNLVKMDKIDLHVFSINFWLVVKHWFAFDKSIHNNQLDKNSKSRGTYQLFGMLRPYVVEKLSEDYDKVMAELTPTKLA